MKMTKEEREAKIAQLKAELADAERRGNPWGISMAKEKLDPWLRTAKQRKLRAKIRRVDNEL